MRSDLFIRIKESDGIPFVLKISSAAMSMACPVWDAKISWFVEQKIVYESQLPSSVENATLPEDFKKILCMDFTTDGRSALLILLRIVHYQFKEFTLDPLPVELITDLAILCDQYDCAHLVVPWYTE